ASPLHIAATLSAPWRPGRRRLLGGHRGRMLYAILCYNDETAVGSWPKAQDDLVMQRLGAVEAALAAEGRLGPVARLLPTANAVTLRKSAGEPLVVDGPFAETKEQ